MALTKSKLKLALVCCLLAVFAVISIAAWFQLHTTLVIDKSEISINKKGERVYQNNPFTGEMVTYHSSSKLARADQMTNGRRQGFAKKWFADGLLSYETNYVNGFRHGWERTWWKNGNPRSETFFVNGKKQGIEWIWYRSGVKFKKANYTEGHPSGIQQEWRENGTLFSNFEYKNGRIYGLRKATPCVGLENENISLDYVKSQTY